MRSRFSFLIFGAAASLIVLGVYFVSLRVGWLPFFSKPQGAVSAEVNKPVPKPVPVRINIADAAAYGAFNLSGEGILGANTEKEWPLASLTKLMTAYVTLKYIPASAVITFDASSTLVGGNAGHLAVGEEYSRDDMLKVMLMMSNNGAAESFADYYGYNRFVAAMNAEAAALGLKETHYTDPTGLDAGDTSTVSDMSRFVDFLWRNNRSIFDLTIPQTSSVTPVNATTTHALWNIDHFAGQPDFLGGKTGTTPQAKDNLIAIMNDPHGSGPVVVIIFGSDHRYEDAQTIMKNLPQ